MRHRKGVTLIELLLVIVILGALVAIALPRMRQSAQNARANACATNIEIMNTQIELYAGDNDGTYPANLQVITGDPNMFPDGPPTCPITGAAYPDALVNNRVDASGHSH
jgi:prepilin-type N-terminal cleavage/methylation domain-containing protein